MSLLHTPKPPPPPAGARKVTRVTDEDLAPVEPDSATPLRPIRRRRAAPIGAFGAIHERLAIALQRGPATALELAVSTGDHLVNVYKALREMRQEYRAHIARVGLPLVYALGPSPAGAEPDIPHLPGDVSRAILLVLRTGPHTSRQVGKQVTGRPHAQSIEDLRKRGFLTRSGTRGEYAYSLTDAGRALVDYIVRLEEAACS